MYKVIFFGTGDFAVPSLTALVRDGRFHVLAVVTQPDRPVGRHATVSPPPVKVAAQELGLGLIQQPEKLKDDAFARWAREIGPACDAFVVVSYGKILPQWLLDLPRRGTSLRGGVVNLHGSLLPRWRGPSPIQAAITAGDARSGVTLMLLDARMDHGPVLAAAETPLAPDETFSSLHDRLAEMGARLLPDALAGYLESRLRPREQDHAQATYCKILTRESGRLDWTRAADELARLVRAYNPWPGAWTVFAGKRLKIIQAAVIAGDDAFKPGQCFVFEKLPAVACGDGTALELLEVQLEGKERMDGMPFVMGQRDWENLLFK